MHKACQSTNGNGLPIYELEMGIVGEFNDEGSEMHFVLPQAEKLFDLIEQGQMTAPLNAEVHTGQLDSQSHPPAVKN